MKYCRGERCQFSFKKFLSYLPEEVQENVKLGILKKLGLIEYLPWHWKIKSFIYTFIHLSKSSEICIGRFNK